MKDKYEQGRELTRSLRAFYGSPDDKYISDRLEVILQVIEIMGWNQRIQREEDMIYERGDMMMR